MRTSKRERTLLIAVIATAIILCLGIGTNLFLKKRAELLAEKRKLQTAATTQTVLLEERDLWNDRSNWLNANLPKATDTETMTAQLFALVSKPQKPGVQTSGLQLLPTEETPNYVICGVRFQAEGSNGALLSWLHEIASPENFRVIRSLEIGENPDISNEILAEIELIRWYAR